VKDIASARSPIEHRQWRVIGDCERAQSKKRSYRAYGGAIVIERPQRLKPRDWADDAVSRKPLQMFYPIVKVILDARAAYKQRRGIDGNAHLNQYVLHFRFMADARRATAGFLLH
jgi:hypothetical protein